MMAMRILLALNHSLDAKECCLDSECEVMACEVFLSDNSKLKTIGSYK